MSHSSLRAPLLCLVTDRLGLAARAGAAPCEAETLTVEQVRHAASSGVDLVQVREPDMQARALARLVRALVEVCRVPGSGARVVVNERLDVALASGAAGVHLRGDSAATARVRAIVPAGFLVGRSVRAADQAERQAREGADYVILGTIFDTPSKPGVATLGLRELARAARAPVPVLAIGGISPGVLENVAATGAAGVAAIRLFQPPKADWTSLAPLVRTWRRMFDTNRPIT